MKMKMISNLRLEGEEINSANLVGEQMEEAPICLFGQSRKSEEVNKKKMTIDV